MYEVNFDDKAVDFLESLDFTVRKRIFNKIMGMAHNPFFYLERLVGYNLYKLRVGKYRVICEVEDNTILILLIGLRKNIYTSL